MDYRVESFGEMIAIFGVWVRDGRKARKLLT